MPSDQPWMDFVRRHEGSLRPPLGKLLGCNVLLEWLQSVGCGGCEVCNRILSSSHCGGCPSCWLAYIDSLLRPVNMPPLDQVLTTRICLRPSVSCGARDLWSICLNAALAGIIAHRDSRAWIDFFILPFLVIPSWWLQRTALHQRNR